MAEGLKFLLCVGGFIQDSRSRLANNTTKRFRTHPLEAKKTAQLREDTLRFYPPYTNGLVVHAPPPFFSPIIA